MANLLGPNEILFSTKAVGDSHNRSQPDLCPVIALLPVGCVEQHGPHLPIQTDTVIAEGLARALKTCLDVQFGHTYVYPAISYTPTETNMDFPGTVSVGADAFANYALEVMRGLVRQFDALVVVNAHGPAEFRLKEIGYRLVHEQFVKGERSPKPVLVVNAYDHDRVVAETFGVTVGRHADWREFLNLYKILGADAYPHSTLKALREFQLAYVFCSRNSAVLGIPMAFRSIQGVQGDPMPFEPELVPAHADRAWSIILELTTQKITETLTDFRNTKWGTL